QRAAVFECPAALQVQGRAAVVVADQGRAGQVDRTAAGLDQRRIILAAQHIGANRTAPGDGQLCGGAQSAGTVQLVERGGSGSAMQDQRATVNRQIVVELR